MSAVPTQPRFVSAKRTQSRCKGAKRTQCPPLGSVLGPGLPGRPDGVWPIRHDETNPTSDSTADLGNSRHPGQCSSGRNEPIHPVSTPGETNPTPRPTRGLADGSIRSQNLHATTFQRNEPNWPTSLTTYDDRTRRYHRFLERIQTENLSGRSWRPPGHPPPGSPHVGRGPAGPTRHRRARRSDQHVARRLGLTSGRPRGGQLAPGGSRANNGGEGSPR